MTVLAERYELGEVLGEGGMGRVVVGHDLVLRRDVAIKLLTSTPDVASRARFLREAQGTARLRHPNAVTVFDTGEHDGQPFIVMELVRGITLAELLEQNGPLDIEEAVGITAGVLDALAAAHAAGLVHRDVKPGNVILPDDGGVKLTDFGIAKALDDSTGGLTVAGTVLGTPTYLAPELIDGGSASPASDLYSVGCMLYVQLTGQPPFTAETPLAVAYAHRNREVPAVEHLRPDVPENLRDVLGTALAKDPSARFLDATQMRDALLGGMAPGRATDATVPLTSAFTPVAPAPTPTPSPAAAGAGHPRSSDAPVSAVAGHPGSDETTVALTDGSDEATAPARSPWAAFAIGAALLVALIAVVLALTTAGGDPGSDDPQDEPVEEPAPDRDEPDGSDEADDPDADDPDADDPDADDPDDTPAPETDQPEETESPEPDEPEAPTEPQEPPPDDSDDPSDDDEGGGGPPDNAGPPGGDGPPGQSD